MGGVKRAGLIVVDCAGNTCCVIRSGPYSAVGEQTSDVDKSNRKKQLPDQPLETKKEQQIINPIPSDITTKGSKNICVKKPIKPKPKSIFHTSGKQPCETPTWRLYQPFLEMVQIPRGTREKHDKDLLHTAIREFCEETLCANNPLYVKNEPVKLYWDDCGKRWTYNIYIAFVKSSLYFAFKPSFLKETYMTVLGVTGRYHTYRLHTTTVSKQAVSTQTSMGSTNVTNRLVIMKTLDYIEYMRNCQLQYYGENNYSLLLDKVEELFSFVFQKRLEAVSNFIDDSSSAGEENSLVSSSVPDASFEEYQTMTPIIYKCMKNNIDVYLQRFERSVYSVECKNKIMEKCWLLFWKGIYERDKEIERQIRYHGSENHMAL